MKTSYKLGLIGAFLYILVELVIYFIGWNHHPLKHLIAFATSSLILLIRYISLGKEIIQSYKDLQTTIHKPLTNFILEEKATITKHNDAYLQTKAKAKETDKKKEKPKEKPTEKLKEQLQAIQSR